MISRVRRPQTKENKDIDSFDKYELFSNDLKSLLSSLQTNNGGSLILDLITCNLNSDTFISYINKFMFETGITELIILLIKLVIQSMVVIG